MVSDIGVSLEPQVLSIQTQQRRLLLALWLLSQETIFEITLQVTKMRGKRNSSTKRLSLKSFRRSKVDLQPPPPGEKNSLLTKNSIKPQQQPGLSLGPCSLVVKVFIVLSKTVTENKCAAQMGP